MNIIRKLLKSETGATAIEYALLAALIAVVIIAGVRRVGQSINATFEQVSDNLPGAK